jgi:hypothetical protein
MTILDIGVYFCYIQSMELNPHREVTVHSVTALTISARIWAMGRPGGGKTLEFFVGPYKRSRKSSC